MTGPLYRSEWIVASDVVLLRLARRSPSLHRLVRQLDRQADQRRPDDPRHRLDAGDRPARREAAEPGERHRPDRAEVRTARRLDQGAEKTAIKQTSSGTTRPNESRQRTVSPFSDDGRRPDSPRTASSAYISLTLRVGQDELDEDEAQRADRRSPTRREKQGIEVAAGGYLGNEVSTPGTESSEAIGIAVAIIVLLFAFGTAAAMPMPILTAIFGLSAPGSA